MQDIVAYLGTFLKDLIMMDTTLQDYLEWFRRQQRLSDEESFRLSRGIEAAADTSITLAKSRKSVVKRSSLPFLALGVIAHSTPIKVQPKPAPDGSSGDSTVSVVTATDTPAEPQHKVGPGPRFQRKQPVPGCRRCLHPQALAQACGS
ncbi:hypothetical protein Q9233_004242 [Columba guinea]|nr:hypothetical protein Q9233_004242 [Columba guinea]